MIDLPVQVRRVTLVVVTLSGVVGFASAQYLGGMLDLDKLRDLEPMKMPFGSIEPQRAADAGRAAFEAQLQSLEAMKTSRVLVLLGLTIAATLTFVGGLRMLRPAGAAREDVRRLLVGTSVICAVLRTIDGAQMTAIARRVGAAGDKVMAGGDIVGGYPEGLLAAMLSVLSIAMTAVVAGGFVGISMYFRSDGVRALMAASDRSRDEA